MRRISITSKDKSWLDAISSAIVINNKPLYKRKDTDCYNLVINNKFITDWFISNNCIPAKSLKVKFPNIENKYLSHFLRGVFDGDGCIILADTKTRKKTIGKTKAIRGYIVSGSKRFIKTISGILDKLEIHNQIITILPKITIIKKREVKSYNTIYRVAFSGTNAVKFFNFIYNNKNIFLDRKYEKFQQYMKIREWELENCKVPGEFENPNKIVKMLKTKTYEEIAYIYNITPKTVIDRLKTLGLFKSNREY